LVIIEGIDQLHGWRDDEGPQSGNAVRESGMIKWGTISRQSIRYRDQRERNDQKGGGMIKSARGRVYIKGLRIRFRHTIYIPRVSDPDFFQLFI
jgi:hypothetical protein